MRQEGKRELNFEGVASKLGNLKSISKSQVNNASAVTKNMRLALDLYMELRPKCKETLSTMKHELLGYMIKEKLGGSLFLLMTITLL